MLFQSRIIGRRTSTRLWAWCCIAACLVIGSGLAPCAEPAPAGFSAGTAKVDITPPPGMALTITGSPIAPREKIYARVLVLSHRDGERETSIAIVSADMLVFASPKVAAEAKKRWGIDHVIQSATHTHASILPRGLVIRPPAAPDWTRGTRAPAEMVDWPGLSADPWYADTETKVVEAIGAAKHGLFPARIAVGKGGFESAYMAHNRRLVTDKGVRMLWENPDRIPTQPVDPTVGVLRVDDLSGKTRALAVHYACHPVATMNAGEMSRDFPGAMVDHVEEELGGECLGIFLQGAQGDIDPYDLSSLRGENRFNVPRMAGISLAKRALEVGRGLDPAAADQVAAAGGGIRTRESLLSIPNRAGGGATDVGLLTVMVGRDLAFVTIPGEPFCQLQLDLARLSPVPNTFMLGLAYHGRGSPFVVYIPTAKAVAEGGYGATECSFLAADAGERIVNEAADAIRALASAVR